jgi:hypothetical protein
MQKRCFSGLMIALCLCCVQLHAQVERYALMPLPTDTLPKQPPPIPKQYQGRAFSLRIGAAQLGAVAAGLDFEWRPNQQGALVLSAAYFQHNNPQKQPYQLRNTDEKVQFAEQRTFGYYVFTNVKLPLETIAIGERPPILPPETGIRTLQIALSYRFYFEPKRAHKNYYLYLQPGIVVNHLQWAEASHNIEVIDAESNTFTGGTMNLPIIYETTTLLFEQTTSIRRRQLLTPGMVYQLGSGLRLRPQIGLEAGGTLVFNPFTDHNLVLRPAPNRYFQVAGQLRLTCAFGGRR